MVHPREPNFFIVGAPKSATTFMDYSLAQHPDIFMCPFKETHYFAADLFPNGSKIPWDRYSSFFEDVKSETVIGESSVFYMLSRGAAEAIRDFCPDAKILIMLRDPIDVIAAHHSQILYETYETEQSLRRALELEQQRRLAHAGKQILLRERVTHYREIVEFSDQIQRFLDRFPREQIHFTIYEDVKNDTMAVYRDVLSFLGVDPTFEANFEIKNANKVLRNRRVQVFLRETPEWVTKASRLLLPHQSLRNWLKTNLKQLNSRRVSRNAVPEDLRTLLAEELKPEVDRLSALLGRDLSHWCRPQ